MFDEPGVLPEPSVTTAPINQTCDYCHQPFGPSTHRRVCPYRRFCCPVHKARWHADRKKARMARLRAIVADLSAVLAELEGK